MLSYFDGYDPFEQWKKSQREMYENIRKATTIKMPPVSTVIDTAAIAKSLQPDISEIRKALVINQQTIKKSLILDSQAIRDALSMQHQVNGIANNYSQIMKDALKQLSIAPTTVTSDYFYANRASSEIQLATEELKQHSTEIEPQTFNQKINYICKEIYNYLDQFDLYDTAKQYDLDYVYLLIVLIINRYLSLKDYAALYGFSEFFVDLIANLFK